MLRRPMNIGRYADHVGTENADHAAQNLFFLAHTHTQLVPGDSPYDQDGHCAAPEP